MSRSDGPSPDVVPAPEPSDEAFASLSGGDLSASEADALRAAAQRDPALAARLARADGLESRLRSEELLPVPVALLGGVLEALRREPPAAWERDASVNAADTGHARPGLSLGRGARVAAAALLVAVGGWLTLGGLEPVAAAADSVATAVDRSFRVPMTGADEATRSLRLPSGLSAADGLPSLRSLVARPSPTAALEATADAVPGGSTTLVLLGAVSLVGAGLLAVRRPVPVDPKSIE